MGLPASVRLHQCIAPAKSHLTFTIETGEACSTSSQSNSANSRLTQNAVRLPCAAVRFLRAPIVHARSCRGAGLSSPVAARSVRPCRSGHRRRLDLARRRLAPARPAPGHAVTAGRGRSSSMLGLGGCQKSRWRLEPTPGWCWVSVIHATGLGPRIRRRSPGVNLPNRRGKERAVRRAPPLDRLSQRRHSLGRHSGRLSGPPSPLPRQLCAPFPCRGVIVERDQPPQFRADFDGFDNRLFVRQHGLSSGELS
jgi:hypothetical protein